MQIQKDFHTSFSLLKSWKWWGGLTKSQNSIFLFQEERERGKGILWNSRTDEKRGKCLCVCPPLFLPSIYILSLPLFLAKIHHISRFSWAREEEEEGKKSALERLSRIKEQRKGTLTRDSLFGQKYVKDAAVQKEIETESWRIPGPALEFHAHFLSIRYSALDLFF